MVIDKKAVKRILSGSATAAIVAFAGLSIVAKAKKVSSVYADMPEQKNPLEGKKVIFVENDNDKMNADGVKGYLEAVEDTAYFPGFYEKYVKRGMAIVLSFGGLIVMVA